MRRVPRRAHSMPFGGLRSGGLANRLYRHRDRPWSPRRTPWFTPARWAPAASRGVRCVATAGSRKGRTVARIIVEVMLKPEIRDPQGEAILQACQRLGFGDVLGVRQGKRFEVEVTGTADERLLARVGELAGELLANPVIEEFTFHEA